MLTADRGNGGKQGDFQGGAGWKAALCDNAAAEKPWKEKKSGKLKS